MIKLYLKSLIDPKKTGKLIQNPYFYIVLAVFFFILALCLHPYDMTYRDFLQQLSVINKNGTRFAALDGIIKILGKADFAIVSLIVLGAVGFRRICYKILVSLIIMSLMITLLKPTVSRERPNGKDNHSFPSGDAGTATALFVTVASQAPQFTPLAALAPAVSFMRNFDDWHYLSDVLAGMGFGLIAVAASLKIDVRRNKYVRKIKPRYFALLSILLSIILYVPNAIQSGGTFFDLFNIAGGTLFLLIISAYLPIIYRKGARKNKLISRMWAAPKKYFLSWLGDQGPDNLVYGFSIIITILGIMAAVITWLCSSWLLMYPVSGLALLLVVYMLIMSRHKKLGNKKRLVYLPVFTLIIFFAEFFICLCPEIIKTIMHLY